MDLSYERKNGYKNIKKSDLDEIFKYAEGYKKFLDNGKTEREVVKETIKLLEEKGYKEFYLNEKLDAYTQPALNKLLYYNNKGKSLFIVKCGNGYVSDIKKTGIKIIVAHIDSPRLDLKQVPLYENSELAFFKTHYYGGIKKYQWLTIPLALHGVIVYKDGSKLELNIGENDDDPVFYITDLLPHLSDDQDNMEVSRAFDAENLNILIGGIPAAGKNKSVKEGILKLLNKKYGIEEEDFLSAEIEVVPAHKARDVGFDRAFISSYGHDDRVCAYSALTAILDEETEQPVILALMDKEEIGSYGDTGAGCILINDIINKLVSEYYKTDPAHIRSMSKCISADVTAAYDPTYSSVFEGQNASYICKGVAMNKFTGSGGKYCANDASAEYVAYIRRLLDNNEIIWQTGELGKVDLGGGGTVALDISKYNIETIDLGVPVLSMHSPNEVIAKIDLYQAYKAFRAFIK